MECLEIAARRLHHQHLWGAPLPGPAAVVRHLGAMQAQEFVPAMWSVAQRCAGVTSAAMGGAFAAGAILRTHALRPTWHFVAPEDIRWVLAVTGPRVNALNAHYYRKLGLDDEAFTTCNALLRQALRGGGQLTRKEVGAWLARNGITASGMHLAYLLMRAELDAIVCSGALSGRQQTYALLDDRAPDGLALSREAGLAELTRRYFRSRGPATVKDFTWWSSLTVAEATAGLEMVGPDLMRTEVDGRTYWSGRDEPAPAAPAPPRFDLVQCYDESLMSYSESRGAMLAPGLQPTGEPMLLHTILRDGQIVGHWKPTLTTRDLTVETFFYRPLPKAQRPALDAAVARLGEYFGVPAGWRPTAS